MADFHRGYELAEDNASRSQRVYRDEYPNRQVSSFAREGNAAGKPTTTRTPELEEAVLHEIEQHPAPEKLPQISIVAIS